MSGHRRFETRPPEAAFASVAEQQALLDATQKLLSVGAQVVRADQDRKTLTELMSHAQEQLNAAQEALRLAKANLAAGTMTVLEFTVPRPSREARPRPGLFGVFHCP